MILKIIFVIIALEVILNLVLFLMKLYERKLDKDIKNLIKDLRYGRKSE